MRTEDQTAGGGGGETEIERLREEVAYWRRDLAARLLFAVGTHRALVEAGNYGSAGQIQLNLRSWIAAYEGAQAGEWHQRCDVCGDFVHPNEPSASADEISGHARCLCEDWQDEVAQEDGSEADLAARVAAARSELARPYPKAAAPTAPTSPRGGQGQGESETGAPDGRDPTRGSGYPAEPTLASDRGPSGGYPSRGPADDVAPLWPLKARVWTRTSVEPPEKVLEIVGTIGDTFMTCRHTQSMAVADDDVCGLPERYVCRCDWPVIPPSEVIENLQTALTDIRDYPAQDDSADDGRHMRNLAEMALWGLEKADKLNAEAQAIEARQGRDEGSACESAVGKAEAPEPAPPQAPDIAGLGALSAAVVYFLRQFRQSYFGEKHDVPAGPSEGDPPATGSWFDTESRILLRRLLEAAAVAPAREDGVDREAVARIIDPTAFRLWSSCDLVASQEAVGQVRAAYTKAAAIIALTRPTGQVRTGAGGDRTALLARMYTASGSEDEGGDCSCHVAGGSDTWQLHDPLCAYRLICEARAALEDIASEGVLILAPGHVQVPRSADEAVAMWLAGERWVRDHAPERLRRSSGDLPPSPDTRPRPADTVPSGLNGGREVRS